MNSDVRLLNEIYKNCQTAIKAISGLLKKAEDEKLYDCLFSQMTCYRELANTAAQMLAQHNCKPKREDFFDKTSLEFTLNIVGVGKLSARRLSKILINGSIEGIYDIANYINSCTDATSSSRQLAYSLIGTEEKNISIMNKFL